MSEYIKCASIKLNTTQFIGRNHAVCLKKMKSATTQGFLTNNYEFVGRKAALKIAIAAGQKIDKHAPLNELLSEDLYEDERYEKV